MAGRADPTPRHSRCNPASTRKIVDFPQPEAPIRLKVSRRQRKLAAETAVFAPKMTCKSEINDRHGLSVKSWVLSRVGSIWP
jgi:hypothetical protein